MCLKINFTLGKWKHGGDDYKKHKKEGGAKKFEKGGKEHKKFGKEKKGKVIEAKCITCIATNNAFVDTFQATRSMANFQVCKVMFFG